MKKLFQTSVLLHALFSPLLRADVSAKVIAYNCYSCHGEQIADLNLPATLSKIQLTNTLLAYKYDKKKATIMNRISKGYSDNELKSVAAYLSKGD